MLGLGSGLGLEGDDQRVALGFHSLQLRQGLRQPRLLEPRGRIEVRIGWHHRLARHDIVRFETAAAAYVVEVLRTLVGLPRKRGSSGCQGNGTGRLEEGIL